MKCIEENCGGKIDTEKWVPVPVGCKAGGIIRRTAKGFPYKKCGRLHSIEEGAPLGIFTRGENPKKAFLIEDKFINN